MNRKDIGEIRRRFKTDKNNIQTIHGCYVNSKKEIIATFDDSVGLLSTEEKETFIGLLKKSLSGAIGRNLIDISFSNDQVVNSPEHKLLSDLRRTHLNDEEILKDFYQKAIEALDMGEDNYLILIANDVYDVKKFRKDGSEDEDAGDTFNYIICAVCPVKTGTPVLGYSEEDSSFRRRSMAQIVGKTMLGFMFPAFDERAANIYNALFYSQNVKEIHPEFIENFFVTTSPLSSVQQRAAFTSAVEDTLDRDCSFSVVQALNEEISALVEQHKESKTLDPLEIDYEEAGEILEKSGMPAERKDEFISACKERFGENAVLSPENIMDSRHFEISTDTVKIKVSPETRPFIKTRMIDGKNYILIPADGNVEINGVAVSVAEKNTAAQE